MLGRVSIPQPEERAKQFPHEFSGGMRQRAMIAMALALNPDLLIADEPTTALDVTVQAQILDLIDRLKDEFNAAVIIITHDLGVVAEHCDNIQVMYAGKAVEYGKTDDIYYRRSAPVHVGAAAVRSRGWTREERSRCTPIQGLPPSLINVPPGAAFHPRCPYVMDVCRTRCRALLPSDGHHASACHLSLGRQGAHPRRGGADEPMSVEATERESTAVGAGPPSRCIRIEGIKKYFPITRGILFQQHGRRRARGGRRRPGDLPGRDARPGGRDRMRQVDARPRRDAAVRSDGGQDLLRGPGHHEAQGPGAPRRYAATCR